MRFAVKEGWLQVRVGNLEVMALNEVGSVGNRFGLTEGLHWPTHSRLSICRALGGTVCCPQQLRLIPEPDYMEHERAVAHAIYAHPLRTRMDTGQDIDIEIPDAMVRDVRVAGSYIPWEYIELPQGWNWRKPPITQLPPEGIELLVDYELDRDQLRASRLY